jgi:cellulose biosynthesis protein BcsQ
VKTIAFFHNKGGVGKTSLVYHLGWAFADAGARVLLADLDPQSNLTAMCTTEERMEGLWPDADEARLTVRGAVDPIVQGVGDIVAAHVEEVAPRLGLLPGDIRLADFEQKLSDAWPRCMDADPAAYRAASSLARVVAAAAERWEAELVLVDVGPNLGAINRSALIAADDVVTPLAADLFSVQGLRNLGPMLARWRREWADRRARNPVDGLVLPEGLMRPIGYVVMQPNLYGGTVTKAYSHWLARVPPTYRTSMLDLYAPPGLIVAEDQYCLGVLRHYRSLMPLAQTARKPIFKLTAADGAIGAHATAVQVIGKELRQLAKAVRTRVDSAP